MKDVTEVKKALVMECKMADCAGCDAITDLAHRLTPDDATWFVAKDKDHLYLFAVTAGDLHILSGPCGHPGPDGSIEVEASYKIVGISKAATYTCTATRTKRRDFDDKASLVWRFMLDDAESITVKSSTDTPNPRGETFAQALAVTIAHVRARD